MRLGFVRHQRDELTNPSFNQSKEYSQYQEKPYRDLYKQEGISESEELKIISSLGGSQTKPLTQVISKLICYLSGKEYFSVDLDTAFQKEIIDKAIANIPSDITELANTNTPLNLTTDRQLEFSNWMRKNGDSERTIKSYSITVMNAAHKFLKEELSLSTNIYDIDNIEDLQKELAKLRTLPSWVEKNQTGNGMYEAGFKKYESFFKDQSKAPPLSEPLDFNSIPLSKPFILLAGISGTGKTRFIRKQAENSAKAFRIASSENYCLIPVRPDWHEPSDLLGYISRLNGVEYVATDFLKFVFKAFCSAIDDVSDGSVSWKNSEEVPPYWLCLDEMNLAPVEQYFADYLSIIETRKWENGEYSSEPLLKKNIFDDLGQNGFTGQYSLGDKPPSGLTTFFNGIFSNITIDEDLKKRVITYVSSKGLPLPPNLIVAGTVNMDETTHGFSRKVIDRALTFDFGEFFPNDFDAFFEPESEPVLLSYPVYSTANKATLQSVPADSDGAKSVLFLKAVNSILQGTPFELAYRALNELLLSVVSFAPSDDTELQAVWDDFLMCKVLPRIEGDHDKLTTVNKDETGDTILDQLQSRLALEMAAIWNDSKRPDLLRDSTSSDEPILIPCRSKKKLDWMKSRLEKNTFTSFWP